MDLVYDAVIPTLFRLVPEARDAYDSWDMPGEPLPYIVFGFLEESLFTPIVDGNRDPDLLRRVFKFLERMAVSRDAQVVNLLWVGLFEEWAFRPQTFAKAVEHMRPATKELASQAFQRITGRDLVNVDERHISATSHAIIGMWMPLSPPLSKLPAVIVGLSKVMVRIIHGCSRENV